MTKTRNSNGSITTGAVVGACALSVASLVAVSLLLHSNNVQNLQVRQSMTGEITVNRDGGWYFMPFPRVWTYPKACLELCCQKDGDAINLQFSNKSTAQLNCQVGYRIDGASDEIILRLHQFAEGQDEKIWQKVYSKLQTRAQCVASQYTPSESVEKFNEFTQKIHDDVVHDKELLAEGIDITFFDCAGLPTYDQQTQEQFSRQKEADLAKRLAEAEKLKLEAETIRTKANYDREIAEFKGKADAETAKMKTEAERQKELATIEAQKKVEVERLEKEQSIIKANKEKEVAEIEVQKVKDVAKIEAEKLREVAEIEKRTEAENLEKVRLIAEQKVANAEAKKKEIELSGAITELQRAELDLQMEIARFKWEAVGKGISGIRLPQMMTIGSVDKDGASVNPLNELFRVMTLERVKAVSSGEKDAAGKATPPKGQK